MQLLKCSEKCNGVARALSLLGQCYAKCSECFDVHCLTVARIFNLFIQLLANFIF